MKRQNGFTLIELVMVIVILGVLAAVAMPKFIDLKGDAQQASVSGVAGAASSAAAINYAGCALTSHVVTTNKCVSVRTCDSVKAALAGGTWPAAGGTDVFAAVATSGTELTAGTNGVSGNCTLQLNTSTGTLLKTASFVIISAANP